MKQPLSERINRQVKDVYSITVFRKQIEELKMLEEQVNQWEDWATKEHIIWKPEDVKRFNEIDSRPITDEEREYSKKCLEIYRSVIKRSKSISDLVEKDSDIYQGDEK